MVDHDATGQWLPGHDIYGEDVDEAAPDGLGAGIAEPVAACGSAGMTEPFWPRPVVS